jgi:riboflavin synthase
MFTGLIESTGTIDGVRTSGAVRVLSVATPLGRELAEGDSIAVNGVCLTVTARHDRGFDVDVSPETLRVTTLGQFAAGRHVNLERPLRADARLGGHFVLGHVDGVGRISSFEPDGECYWLEVDVPAGLARYLISKGSIAIDGISLTIARLRGASAGVQIIPFTSEHTALSQARAGDEVNLEADVLGKYVARLMDARAEAGGAETGSAGRS